VHERGAMGLGPAQVVAEAIARYAASGATDLCVRFVGNDQLEQMDRFTAEVLPLVTPLPSPSTLSPHPNPLPSGERAG
jgi:hypothetical protein